MNLYNVIQQIRTYCPSYAARVAGSARYQRLPEDANLPAPACYVIPLDDSVGEKMAINDVYQQITESFSVVVVLSNVPDERGQAAGFNVHDTARAELWAALLGWQPDGLGGNSRYATGIYYQGGNILDMDRSRLWYQFDFAADMQIVPADGWQAIELGALPHFDGVTINEDDINPAFDANIAPNGGPDGRIEHVTTIPKTGTLP